METVFLNTSRSHIHHECGGGVTHGPAGNGFRVFFWNQRIEGIRDCHQVATPIYFTGGGGP